MVGIFFVFVFCSLHIDESTNITRITYKVADAVFKIEQSYRIPSRLTATRNAREAWTTYQIRFRGRL